MNKSEIIKWISERDPADEDFFEVYCAANQRYFTFNGEGDKFQKSSVTLNLILHRGEEWMIEILATMGEQFFEVVQKDIPASHGSFEIKGKPYFFDLYQNKESLASVHKMFRNTVLMKANETPKDAS